MKKKILIASIALILIIGGYILNKNKTSITYIKEKEDNYIIVEIKGEVIKPGVYEVLNDYRISDVINICGGITPYADLTSINMAKKINDGEVIFIPSSKDSRININFASLEELTSLEDITFSKAENIISYREKNGRFNNIDDLLNVTGITKTIFEKIKNRIKV